VSGEASDRRVTPTTRQCFRVVVAICCAPLGLTAAASALLLPADGSRLIWLVVAMLASELAAAGTVLIRLRKAIRPEQFLEPRPLPCWPRSRWYRWLPRCGGSPTSTRTGSPTSHFLR
jgi:hypothetical protein